MKKTMGVLTAFLLTPVMFAACGATDPGSGSNTLFIDADVDYSADDGYSRAQVVVKKDGKPVSKALVTIIGEGGDSFKVSGIRTVD